MRSHCAFDGYSLGDDRVTCEYPGIAAGASATYDLIFSTVAEIGGMGGIFDYHQLTVDAVDVRVKTDSNPPRQRRCLSDRRGLTPRP